MLRPTVPAEPRAGALPDGLRSLLAEYADEEFEDKCDMAIVRLFVDTGMRRAELLGLRVADIVFGQDVALVMGKGRKARASPFGSKIGLALGRYLRVRSHIIRRGKSRSGSTTSVVAKLRPRSSERARKTCGGSGCVPAQELTGRKAT